MEQRIGPPGPTPTRALPLHALSRQTAFSLLQPQRQKQDKTLRESVVIRNQVHQSSRGVCIPKLHLALRASFFPTSSSNLNPLWFLPFLIHPPAAPFLGSSPPTSQLPLLGAHLSQPLNVQFTKLAQLSPKNSDNLLHI